MKIHRPLWTEGAFLTPQQFQQQALWDAHVSESVAQMAQAHPWGVSRCVLDKAALRLGRLSVEQLRLRFQDGTLIDSDVADRLPAARDLACLSSAEPVQVVVMLALPLLRASGNNCLPADTQPDRPVRYRQIWQQVQNLLGDDSEQMATECHALSLRFEHEENGEYLTCPIARLTRDSHNGWTQDEQFIPPLLCFSAQPILVVQLERLVTQLRARRTRLMAMRRENNQRMADFAVADVSLFWLLNALNSHEPVLNYFLTFSHTHPEPLYREIVRLAGALLTFSLEHDISAIPPYNHARPGTVFPPLFELVSHLLETSLPSRVVSIELEQPRSGQWLARLHDLRLREGADFYLSVRSALPAHQLQTLLPQLCKAGAPDEVNSLINVALDGIPLIPLSHVPAAIPMRLENQYFALDLNHRSGQAMLEAGICQFYVPAALADIQPELYAVLRS
ncbi:type VI secretion system baseplate subunit TssK [Enterobacteriaceae bacterium LUAb1]